MTLSGAGLEVVHLRARALVGHAPSNRLSEGLVVGGRDALPWGPLTCQRST
jgi:hypothetical protein